MLGHAITFWDLLRVVPLFGCQLALTFLGLQFPITRLGFCHALRTFFGFRLAIPLQGVQLAGVHGGDLLAYLALTGKKGLVGYRLI